MKNVLSAIAFVFAIGPAPAGAIDKAYSLDAFVPAARPQIRQVAASSLVPPYSLVDIFSFRASDPQSLPTIPAGRSPRGAAVELTHIGGLPLASRSSVDGAGPIASSTGVPVDRSRALAAGAISARASGAANRLQGDGFLPSVPAAPEPSGGAMLLCGLAVLAFIARRKIHTATH